MRKIGTGRLSACNNWPIPINTKLFCCVRLQLLSENSHLLEGLQSADKTKMHQNAKVQNAPTFSRNASHSHVCLLLVIKIKNLYLPIV